MMDIGPDEVFLEWEKKNRTKSTQTTNALTWNDAERIVKNFEIIESHWKSIERENTYLSFICIGLGVALLGCWYYG